MQIEWHMAALMKINKFVKLLFSLKLVVAHLNIGVRVPVIFVSSSVFWCLDLANEVYLTY